MTDSILNSVKLVLGLDPDDTSFDTDVLMHINTALATLDQIGVAPSSTVFYISDSSTTWTSFIQSKREINLVKTYVVLKVRLAFDPPQTSFAIAAIENQIKELEWRLNQLEDLFVTS